MFVEEAAESGLRKGGPSVLVVGESLPQPWEQGPSSLVPIMSRICYIVPFIMFRFMAATAHLTRAHPCYEVASWEQITDSPRLPSTRGFPGESASHTASLEGHLLASSTPVYSALSSSEGGYRGTDQLVPLRLGGREGAVLEPRGIGNKNEQETCQGPGKCLDVYFAHRPTTTTL